MKLTSVERIGRSQLIPSAGLRAGRRAPVPADVDTREAQAAHGASHGGGRLRARGVAGRDRAGARAGGSQGDHLSPALPVVRGLLTIVPGQGLSFTEAAGRSGGFWIPCRGCFTEEEVACMRDDLVSRAFQRQELDRRVAEGHARRGSSRGVWRVR